MILYTTVPYDLIFQSDAKAYNAQMVMEHNGIPLLVQQEENKYRVIRVMSSDPAHFLNDSVCPGEFITN
ncbi:YlzJ-like family protein [Rossellomorea aquimaris]|uniref:YlzJ-like family protein n=1 Tax=Rossellomorea aquimaris TaxID=189382 RepID=UPI0007D0502E|nr:YlzJ-like family protein [Rossellomorea aquimaris]